MEKFEQRTLPFFDGVDYLENSYYLPDVTRFEVVDGTGRAYFGHGVEIRVSFQDEGRSFKIFVRRRIPAGE